MKIWTKMLATGALLLGLSSTAQAEGVVTFSQLSSDMALKLAQAALEACRAKDMQVTVAVVDRAGNVQLILRDTYAGAHTPDTARRKAYTAVSFRTPTTEMSEFTQAGQEASGVRFVTDALMVGGGIAIEAAGGIVGGIGVSGSPSGQLDDECARAGIEEIAMDIEF